MKIGFIINDLDSMNLEKDTSIYLMKEAHAKGNEVYAFDSKDVTHKKNALYADCKAIDFPNAGELNFVIKSTATIELKDFDFVIKR